MTRELRFLRIAAALLLLLGVGHLVLIVVLAGSRMAPWLADPWAAVPLGAGAEPTVASLQNAVAFWGGYGSFGVPLALLGGLVWWGAGRGFVPPAWCGWVLIAWFAVGTVLLVPSPMPVGIVPGVLIVLAARSTRRRG